MYIGPSPILNLPTMWIGEQSIAWSQQIKYLGIWINSHKSFNIDLTVNRRNFFMTLNCILSKMKFACDLVKLKILESHCLSLLMYGIDSGVLDTKQLLLVNSWWNSVYRKIFGYFKWESVRNLIGCLQKLNFIHKENLQRILFIKNIIDRPDQNPTLYGITNCYMYRREFQSVLQKCNVNISWSISKIKKSIKVSFGESCLKL